MIVDHFCLLQQYEIKQNQNTIAAIDHKRARLQDFFSDSQTDARQFKFSVELIWTSGANKPIKLENIHTRP